MADSSSNHHTKPEPLALHEIISRFLAPKLDPSPSLPWWMGLGTMPSLNQKFARQPLLNFLNASLRGIAQVIFTNNPISGLLILTAMFVQSPWIGLLAFLGSASATLTAVLIKSNPFMIQDGVFGLNGMLIGAAMGFFGQFGNGKWNLAWAIATIVLAALTTIVMQTVGLWFTSRFRVSPLGIPFNGVMLPFLLLVVMLPQTIFDLGLPPPPFEPGTYDHYRLAQSIHLALGQVFFSDNPLSVVLVMLGVFICSPTLGLVTLLGGLMYILAGWSLEAKPDELYLSIWGYNAVLTAAAIGGTFYAPTRLSIILAAVCSFLAASLSFLLAPIFATLKLPVLSVPFAIVTIGCLLIVERSLPSLVPVALHTIASPEEHRQRFLAAKDIISNFRRRLEAIMQRKKVNNLSEEADSSVKGDLHYIFNAIDQDNSNHLSILELTNHLQQSGQTLSITEITMLFKSMDKDNSGTIDFEEFAELMLRHRQLMSKYDKFVTYFVPIDANQDNAISISEMNIAMASVGEPPLRESELLFLREQFGEQPLTWNQFITVLLVT